MSVCLVLITYNRLHYTKMCLQHLLRDPAEDFELVIWDNASTDDTRDYLSGMARDPRIKDIVLSKENLGATAAMNRVWGASKADLLGKIDNDILVTPGWTTIIAKAHFDVEHLGAVACWHFRREDFVDGIARWKVADFCGHKIFQHPFVCGTGFLLKRKVFAQIGEFPEGSPDIGATDYFIRLARSGYVNGWYYPLILQDHMDDPLSPNCPLKTDDDIRRVQSITFTFRKFGINTMAKRLKRRKTVIEDLHYGSPHAIDYEGWRAKLRYNCPAYDKWRWHLLRLAGKV